MLKLRISFIILLFCSNFYGQKTFKGVIKDKNSKEDLAYVNIGVVNQNTGTVSDSNGKFEFICKESLSQEIIKISMIGYITMTMKVVELEQLISRNEVIYLEKSIAELKEIVIKNKKLKTATLGNILGKKTVAAGFVNNVLGNEIGIIVKIKKKPTFIESFNAMVAYNKYKEFKFRINFYGVKKGLPDKNLLQENIIVTSKIKNGLLSIDLSDYNIVVYEDFFVSIELIEGLGEGGLRFMADYEGSPIITRAVSQGKWNKKSDLSFGFNLTTQF